MIDIIEIAILKAGVLASKSLNNGADFELATSPASAVSLVLLMIVLLCLSAFFSGSETALFSLNKMQISHLRNHYPRLSRAVVKLLRSANNTLTSILLGNTLVNIGLALCAAILADKFLARMPIVSFLVGAGTITVIILIFGEIMPKTVAVSKPEIMALIAAQPLLLWYRIISPFRALIHLLTDKGLSLLRIVPATNIATLTEEEFKILLSTSELDNILPKDEKEMIAGVLELAESTVEDVMTPRPEIVGFPSGISRQEITQALKTIPHNRVVIYKDTIDNIVGVLHTKDLLLHPDKPVEELLREPLFVPPKKSLIDMLAEFRRTHSHFAVVMDEFGGVGGIITLQDILEEIVSELEETPGRQTKFIQQIGEDEYLVAGNTEIWRLKRELKLNLCEETARTIAGFIINTLGGFPEVDEGLIVGNVRLTVAQKTKKRITQVRLKILNQNAEADEHSENL